MQQYKNNKNNLNSLELDNLQEINILILDSFKPELRLELLKEQQSVNKKLWRLKSKMNYGEKKEFILSAEKMNELLNKLKALELPEYEELAWGLDGITYKIEFITKNDCWFYEWWGDVPKGYEAFKELIDYLTRLVKMLPGNEIRRIA